MRDEWWGRVGWRVISAIVESSMLVKLVTMSLSQADQEAGREETSEEMTSEAKRWVIL